MYVGISKDVDRRLHNHETGWPRHYWNAVERVELKAYDTYLDASKDEIKLIDQYRPPMNRSHNPLYPNNVGPQAVNRVLRALGYFPCPCFPMLPQR